MRLPAVATFAPTHSFLLLCLHSGRKEAVNASYAPQVRYTNPGPGSLRWLVSVSHLSPNCSRNSRALAPLLVPGCK